MPTKSNKPDIAQFQARGDLDGLFGALSRSRDVEVRQRAAIALGQAGGPRAVKALIRALKSKNARVRTAAARALWWTGDKEAVRPLIRALNDPASEVIIAAIKALGKIKDQSAVNPLTEKLQMRSATGRMAVAEALGELHDPRALGSLTHLLLSRISKLRETVLSSLVQIDPEWTSTEAGRAALAKLTGRLKHRDPHLRRGAATTLGQIGEHSVAPQLVSSLSDPESKVRRAVVDAIIQLGAAETIDPLAESLLNEITTAGGQESQLVASARYPPWIEGKELSQAMDAAIQLERLMELHADACSTSVLELVVGLSDRRFRYNQDPYDPYDVVTKSLEYDRIRSIASSELERRVANG